MPADNHPFTFKPTLLGAGASRRNFLKYSAAAGTGVLFGKAAMAAPSGAPANPANFGIMFPTLRGQPFAHPDDTVRRALLEIGKRGGIMDVNEDLSVGAKRLALDPTVNGSPTPQDPFGKNPYNLTQPQGTTFFGQMIDHDITFDQTSILGAPANPLLSRNQQSAALDLDTIFGKGPTATPALYVAAKNGTVGPKMKVGNGGAYEYYPYTTGPDGAPKLIMADPGRNNAVIPLEGLVLAYILAYNRVLDDMGHLDLQHLPTAQQFKKPTTAQERHQVAREVITWHYHWLIVNEFLPQIVGQSLVSNILQNGNRYYNPPAGNAFLPIEFGSAAFRYGHAQVDSSYIANFASGKSASSNPDQAPFWGLTFDPSIPAQKFDKDNYDRPDMLGGYPAKRRYVGWQTYFDFGDGRIMHNKKIKPALSTTMLNLPVPAIAPGTETSPISLAQRNLLRQLTWAMPSGQTLAKEIGAAPLTPADLELIGSIYTPFATETPLWYYVLAEAKVAANGNTLGPVGGLIVAETLIGLIRSNPNSYLNKNPEFKPFLGSDLKIQNRNAAITGSHEYTTANLLSYAGVVKPGVYR